MIDNVYAVVGESRSYSLSEMETRLSFTNFE